VPEIGFLNSGSKAEFAHLLAAFRDGLKMQGFAVAGSRAAKAQPIKIYDEWADGDYAQLAPKAKRLFDRDVTVLAATGGIGAARAAQDYAYQIKSRIPIIFASGRDAPRPGDLTANAKAIYLAMSTPTIENHNRYQRLRDLMGADANIFQLINKGSPVHTEEGNWPKPVEAGSVKELHAAFQYLSEHKADGLVVSGDPFFNSHRSTIVRLAAKHKIAACYPWREYVEAGGLMSHGPNLAQTYRRLGIWAGIILGGATNARDLPDAEPGHRELVVNLRAAKKLGITGQKLSKLLLMADEMIR
jgi:putative ABC transport system substrate-binding protein